MSRSRRWWTEGWKSPPILSGYMVDMFLEMAVLDLPFMTRGLGRSTGRRPKNCGPTTSNGWPRRISSSWPSEPGLPSSFSRPRKPSPKWKTGKGPKIRVYGAETAEADQGPGGAPVNIPFGEVYTALQRNVADGAITSATNAEPMKFFEVTKFINYWYHQRRGH